MRRKLYYYVFTSITLLFFPNKLHTQWVQTAGPYGVKVSSFLNTENRLFVSCWEGIFSSTNNGVTWKSTSTGLTHNVINALAKSSSSSTIYAGTLTGGVYISVDNGGSWKETNTGLTNKNVYSLLAYGGSVFAGTKSGIFLSTDIGATWTSVNNGLTNLDINDLAIAPGVEDTSIFVATANGGLFRSKNNGSSWLSISTGLNTLNTWSLAVDTTNIIAPIIFVGTTSGVFRSSDDGSTWHSASVGVTNQYILSLTFSQNDLFAGTRDGLFRSTDHGTNWSRVDSSFSDLAITAIEVIGSNLITGSFQGGVFLSSVNGSNWKCTGLPTATVNSIVINKGNIYAGTTHGIFMSSDEGTSWDEADNGVIANEIMTLCEDADHLYAGTDNGLYISNNKGMIWTPITPPGPYRPIFDLEVNGINLFAAGPSAGVFRTSDYGISWDVVNTGLSTKDIYTLAVFNVDSVNSNIFAGSSEGVFISKNNGEKWQLTSTVFNPKPVRALAISPEGEVNRKLFVGTSFGEVFFSTDNGQSWKDVTPSPILVKIKSFAFSGKTLFVGTESAIYSTSDNGSNWTAIDTGLLNKAGLALRVYNGYLFLGSLYGGIWKRSLSELTKVAQIEAHSRSYDILEQNYPNPFNPTTHIQFRISLPSFVTLKVFDIVGRHISTLVSEKLPSGNHTRDWNAISFPSGVYYCVLEVDGFKTTRKLVLIK